MRAAIFLAVAALALASSSCEHRAPPAAPADFSVIRDYGWDTDVAEPQAAWSPNDYRVLSRSADGFVVLRDESGQRPVDSYKSVERRETHFPAWINGEQVVFGADRNADKLPDGTVVPVPDGLTLVELGAKPVQKQLAKIGFHPRVGRGAVYAQSEDRMLIIDEQGGVGEFGRGFYPEPQRDGDGIAWQETPVISEDWWTGKPVRANLIVRWREKKVDTIPSAIQPRWSADGGIAATVLRGDPPSAKRWWKAGSDVVWIAGPGQAPVIVAYDARDPAPHPTQPVIAVATNAGKILLVSRDGKQRAELGDGCNPQWSWDGTRLLVEQVPNDEPPLPTRHGDQGHNHLTVHVVAVKAPLKQ
jgi:hypothetical protein